MKRPFLTTAPSMISVRARARMSGPAHVDHFLQATTLRINAHDALHTVVLASAGSRNQLQTASGSEAFNNIGQPPLVTPTPGPATFGAAGSAPGAMAWMLRSSIVFVLLIAAGATLQASPFVSGFVGFDQFGVFLVNNNNTLCQNDNGGCSGYTQLYAPVDSYPGVAVSYYTTGVAQYGVLKAYSEAQTIPVSFGPPYSGTSPYSGLAQIFASSAASFSDQWTITGGTPGSTGSMDLFFNLTGTYVTSGPGSPSAYLQLMALEGDYNTYFNVRHGGGPALIVTTSVSESGQVSLTIPFVFGVPRIFTVQMQAQVLLGPGSDEELPIPIGMSGIADASHTAVLSSVVVRNSSGAIVPYQLQTASGATAFDSLGQSPLGTSTPEPATWGVAGLALGGMAWIRNRRTCRRPARGSQERILSS